MTPLRARAPRLALVMMALACAGPGSRRPDDATAPRPTGSPRPVVAQGRYGEEPVASLSALELDVIGALRARRGHAPLETSAALCAAARELARAASDGAPDALSPVHLRTALARGLSFDPAPRAWRVEASPGTTPGALIASVVLEPTDSHVGVGAVTTDGRVDLVVLVTARRAVLEPFPREVEPGRRAVLRGRLVGLARPTVHVTSPAGTSASIPVRGEGPRFEAPLAFETKGRWSVEVVGEGPRGPTVAALLTVSSGGAPLDAPAVDDSPDPADLTQAEARVVAAIARTRARQGLAPLQASPSLAAVARRHSEAMLRAGVLAHRLDPGDGAADRLRRAHVPFALVLENVAKGPSAIAAHRLAEESPAHRQNILSSEATRVGVGIARGSLPGGEPIVYVTELFTAVAGDPDQDPLTPEGRVREAIWRERARAGARPLAADAQLDQLAREAVREMVRRGEPDPGDLPRRALALGRKVAAADAFLTAKAADAARSGNVADPRFNRVGVSVGIGDPARAGAGMLWIAIVYSD